MALHVFVFVFLLVVCLLLTLARLGRLEWFQLRPSSSQDGAKCSRFPRRLKPTVSRSGVYLSRERAEHSLLLVACSDTRWSKQRSPEVRKSYTTCLIGR